ncbi:hypothetical protein CKO23_16370 [Thiocystis violacea]|nr:hypothetical protein [Thiocystis violacea]
MTKGGRCDLSSTDVRSKIALKFVWIERGARVKWYGIMLGAILGILMGTLIGYFLVPGMLK